MTATAQDLSMATVIARLAAIAGTPVAPASINGIAAIPQIAESTIAAPAWYVMRKAEGAKGDESSSVGYVQQEIACAFSVITAVSNQYDPHGANADEDLRAMRAELKQSLIGWVPAGMIAACEFVGGELLDFDDQILLWIDTFAVPYYQRSQ